MLAVSATSAAFYAATQLSSDIMVDLLKALNSPLITYGLVLVSVLVDVLATSLSLTFVSTFFQTVISSFACISMLCSIWFLFVVPVDSVEGTGKDHLLSVRHPLASYYRLTKSIICDDSLNLGASHSKQPADAHLEDDKEDYLSEFNEFLYSSL